MEKGILEIQPYLHSALLELFPDCFMVFHREVYVTNEFIDLGNHGDMEKGILEIQPTYMVPCWYHFLTALSSSIWKYI